MSTNITNTGAEKGGDILTQWSNIHDFAIDLKDGITIAPDVVAETRKGDDIIEGEVSNGTAVNNRGSVDTGKGGDLVLATVRGSGSNRNIGINNTGTLKTDRGSDQVRGNIALQGGGNRNIALDNNGLIETGAQHDIVFGEVEIKNGSGNRNVGIRNRNEVSTGSGDDWILGEAIVKSGGINNIGINNSGSLKTASGRDWIFGEVKGNGTGLLNTGTIDMGGGKDDLTGEVSGDGFGLDNRGTIDMGSGNDVVRAQSGLTGGGTLYLGAGNDTIFAFGDQIINGGSGKKDMAVFDFELNGDVELGSSASNAIDVTVDGVTMSFVDVERFQFSGASFKINQLIDMI